MGRCAIVGARGAPKRADLMKCNKSRVNANPGRHVSRIIQFISKRSRRVAGPSVCPCTGTGPRCVYAYSNEIYTCTCIYARRVSRNVPFKIARKVPDPRRDAQDHDFSDRDTRLSGIQERLWPLFLPARFRGMLGV